MQRFFPETRTEEYEWTPPSPGGFCTSVTGRLGFYLCELSFPLPLHLYWRLNFLFHVVVISGVLNTLNYFSLWQRLAARNLPKARFVWHRRPRETQKTGRDAEPHCADGGYSLSTRFRGRAWHSWGSSRLQPEVFWQGLRRRPAH